MDKKIFIVNFKETQYGFVEVEAKNAKEAREKARDLEEQGMVNWTGSEQAKITSVELYKITEDLKVVNRFAKPNKK